MTKRMLIDATHAEETRVAIVEEDQLVEFDYESKVRKQLKGGIYLAKVTRVEPSLQAAFVNFGGNRHGFLPFSEIHPDYFRIPVSDREALMAAQEEELERLAALDAEEEALEDAEHETSEGQDDVIEGTAEVVETDDDSESAEEDVVEIGGADKPAEDDDSDLIVKASFTEEEDEAEEEGDNAGNVKADDTEKSDEELDAEALEALNSEEESSEGNKKKNNRRGRNNRRRRNGRGRSNMRSKRGREVSEEDGGRPYRFSLRHKYKIQEVVKRGQVMLIQVSKEERGNKGAAVTTYLSLPGRYCVLMPNSPRAGGVSRKIGNFKDRKRMREILKELSVPQGMSVILRTAGVSRTKAEIKRDLDYLTRLWNNIREDTLSATAPALINQEGNLIKRSIRDLYTRDIDEVLVSGDRGFKTAKDFMKMLVPSHAKKVQEYNDDRIPLFHRYHVEKQIAEIGQMTANLKSGGYLVINPTEALVSVDVNSGRATKERHIEETALNTNLEAAEEVARQLRLRDLGGLVVIDFIDMEERRNNRKVENKLRSALSDDRARIQVGRISSFGLLELSRQRLNPSITEAQFETCPHCEGTGVIKTLDFAAISAMRALEEEGIKGHAAEISLNLPNRVAVYILNNKRPMLDDIEKRYDFRVHIRVNEDLKESEFLIDVMSKKDGADNAKAKNDKDDEETPKKQSRNRRRGKRGGKRNNNRNQDDAQEGQSEEASEDDKNSDTKKKKPARKKPAAKKDNKQSDKKEAVEGKSEKDTDEKAKKPAKKSVKKSEKQADKKPEAKKKMPKPSNDVAEEQPAKDYEVVNAEPKKKKKGWWSKIVE